MGIRLDLVFSNLWISVRGAGAGTSGVIWLNRLRSTIPKQVALATSSQTPLAQILGGYRDNLGLRRDPVRAAKRPKAPVCHTLCIGANAQGF